MINKQRLILFDIGGVLLRFDNSFQKVSRELSIPLDLIQESFKECEPYMAIGELSPQEFFNQLIERHDLEISKTYDFLTNWSLDFERINETQDFLTMVIRKHSVGIVSNIYTGMYEKFISYGILPNVEYDYFFASCDIGYRKPDLSIFRYIEQQTKMKKQEILLIDDSLENINAASLLGWRTHRFDTYNPSRSIQVIKTLLSPLIS